MCVHALNSLDKNQLADVSYLIFVDLSAIWLANLASKGAIFVRGGVLKSTLVVDNDTTVHGCAYEHSRCQSISRDQV